MAHEPTPFVSARRMLELAALGVGKIDRDGVRGATRVSVDEITAMAGALVSLGLIPVAPDATTFPETLLITLIEEPTDVRL